MAEQYQVEGSNAAAISSSIESGVRTGRIDIGAQLPPVRVLAEQLHVSPATVAKAYSELRQRGVVEASGRRGTRVRSRPAVAASRSALRPPVPAGVLDLSTGEPDVRLLPALGPFLADVAESLGPPIGYAEAGAMPELIEAAAHRLHSSGVPLARADITVTSSALDAIERLLSVHVRPGDVVAVEDPSWANLLDLIAALGLRPVPMTVDDEGPVPGAMAAALAAGARAVVVTSRAQNPTGAAVSFHRAAELRGVLANHQGVLLIEDDHAAELAGAGLRCVGPVTGAWGFVRSSSKPYGPDLRVAVLAGDEATIARVVGRMRIGSGWVSTMLQRLLLRLWADPVITEQVYAAADSYEDRRTELVEALAELGITARGNTGINVWVNVPDETHAVGVMRDQGYAVAPGSLFRIRSEPAVRITISPLNLADIPALARAVAGAVSPAAVASPSR